MNQLRARLKSPSLLQWLFLLPLSTLWIYGASTGTSASKYWTNEELGENLKQLAANHSKILRLESVAEALSKQSIWLLELGNGTKEERNSRPALLLVAGIEGTDLAGTSSAVAWAESLVDRYGKEDAIRKLLDTTTLYIFPRLNSDAAQSFSAKPSLERTVSNLPTDGDHDGLIDEDGPEDLNGDGQITSMRVQDSEGEYILDPLDPRLLMKADKAKGEQGAWRLLSEGTDNDHDEKWNEDGLGGVDFNRNFPYNYRFFEPWSGKHQVSEVETRALADFVVGHPNIGVVFTFGSADNLVQTPEGKDEEGRKPATNIRKDDVPFYRELGSKWRETLGLKKELKGSSEPGTFSDWMYFHRGRLSLAARPWNPTIQLQMNEAAASGEKKTENTDKNGAEKKEDEKKPDDKKEADKPAKPAKEERNEEERAFAKWTDENYSSRFIKWTEFAHPDFPGRKVEIGGFAPFAKTNPPEAILEALTKKHAAFLTELAGKLPRISIRKSEVKHLGNSVYEITLQVENQGYLPTILSQGKTSQEVLPTRVVLENGQNELLSGRRITILESIDGSGGMAEARWTLYAKEQKKIKIAVISAIAGSLQVELELNQENPKP